MVSLNSARIQVRILLLACIGCCLASCNSSTDPGRKGGKRDYTWTVDTISYPGSGQTLMRRIWGSSAQSVWVVGHNELGGPGTMYSFDGVRWSEVPYHVSIHGNIGLRSVIGFDRDDLIAVGVLTFSNQFPPPAYFDSSLVIRLRGSSWVPEVLSGSDLETVWGSVANNVWTAGVDGTVYHFDGNVWSREFLPISVAAGSFYIVNAVAGTNTLGTFALARSTGVGGGTTSYYFLKRDESGWVTLDSSLGGPPWGETNLWVSPGGDLYSSGRGLYRWIGQRWELVLATNADAEYLFGTEEDNIFFTTWNDGVYHYNGLDWAKLSIQGVSSVGLTSGWTDGSTVFLVGQALGVFPQKTLIFRGK